MAISNIYPIMLNQRLKEIIEKEELPTIYDFHQDIAVLNFVRCYCDKCGHQKIEKSDKVYEMYPVRTRERVLIRAECVQKYRKEYSKSF